MNDILEDLDELIGGYLVKDDDEIVQRAAAEIRFLRREMELAGIASTAKDSEIDRLRGLLVEEDLP